MKVYEISTLAKPPGRFPHFSGLECSEADYAAVRSQFFLGTPYPRGWKSIELYVAEPKWPRPDFFRFGGVFVCNLKAMELAGEALEMSGELLPVTVEGDPGEFAIFNVTNCINALDKKKSTYRPLGKNAEFMQLHGKVFHPDRFEEATIFKIPDDGAVTTHCFERSGDSEDGEFKALVEANKLTGLEFKLIWDSQAAEQPLNQ